MAADPVTGYDPDDDLDLKEANDRFKAAGDQDVATQAQETFTKAAPASQQPTNGFQHWFTNLPQNVGSGLINAAINTADTAHSAWKWVNEGQKDAAAKVGLTSQEEIAHEIPTPEYSEVRNAVQDFKQKYVDVQNPNLADNITQGVAQFAIPFLGWSKAVSAVGGASKVAALGRLTFGEAATAGTAMAPHDGRFADMLDLGRHTEGKFADALNAISPDGSLVNNYINYMTNRVDEGEAEGRAKNIVDTLTGGAVISPLITTGMRVLKGGMEGLKYSLENGVGSVDQLAMPNQEGRIGYHGTPANFDVDAGFDNSKIGAGEGNQTFGYGHYLAESPGVAKTYQTRLAATSSASISDVQSALRAAGGDKVRAYKDLTSMAADEQDIGLRMRMQKAASLIKAGNYDRGAGSFVTADVPDEHIANMIDHDAPLADQPKVVQDAFRSHGIGGEEDISGGEAYKALADKLDDVMPGHGPAAASALLDTRGVPGVKYLDGQSRAGGEGTRNLVVFNGKNIKVLKKE